VKNASFESYQFTPTANFLCWSGWWQNVLEWFTF